MIISDTQFQELTDKVEKLQPVLDSVSNTLKETSEHIKEIKNFQLVEPLDMFTRTSINNQITTVITHNLVGAEAATAVNYNHFFIADRSYIINSVLVIFGTKGTDGSAVTLDIYKGTDTVAIGSGTSILTSTIDLKGTINVINKGALKTGNFITLRQYDRLGLILSGTPTAVANLSVTISLLLL